jgi:hypothetical protein
LSRIVQREGELDVCDRLRLMAQDVEVRMRNREGERAGARPGGRRRGGDRGTQVTTMSVYTSADEPPPELLRALGRLMRLVGLETVETSDVERGSWFRRWKLRVTRTDSARTLARLAKKGERAADLHFIQTVRAQADEHEANAVASVVRAAEGMDSAVIQLSSLIVVKHGGALICRVLTEREIGILADHPELLKSPAELFQILSERIDQGEHRRRIPMEDDPFGTDEKAAPPVIGL